MDPENKSFHFMVRPGLGVFTPLVLFVVLFTVVSCSSSFKEVNKEQPLNDFVGYLENRIPHWMDKHDIPGVNIALIQKGKIVWSEAFGHADLANGRKMTTDTYCRVESISKSVTAWGVLKLVQEGKVSLDSPITQYLKSWSFPESRFSTDSITIRQLLSQTSGMPLGTIGVRYAPDENRPTLKESLSGDAVLFREPGQTFSYSNTGFNLLELLIEEVTGQDFADYMQQEVLLPLGMKNSSFDWSENFDPPVPFGYDTKGNMIPVYVYPDRAAGGLFSTVGDIAAFVAAGMTDFSKTGLTILNEQLIEKLYTPEVELSGYYGLVFDFYGLGHFIEQLPNGERAVSHGGQGSGWMSHFHSVPESGDGIVILTNSQRSWPFFASILSDWAAWNNFPSLGMGTIVTGTKIVWGFIVLFLVVAIWHGWRLGWGLVSGKRGLTFFSREHQGIRLLQLGLSAFLFTLLLWSFNQEYLFINSLFPVASPWLGVSLFLVALVLLGLALFPKTKVQESNGNDLSPTL